MCGICGIIYDDPSHPVERHILERMNDTMIHRGPDDEGYFIGRGAGLAIRRLSIIDVEGGHQPMSSEDGGIYSVINGEIYNFKELKRELMGKGHVFRTGSDAEVLPHLYQEYGAKLVEKLNGMFGLAVWDERERVLLVARDRMGEKPLYWAQREGFFIFASELKAILAHPEIDARPDRASLSKYLAYEYVPAPHTIVEGVHKLEPAQLITLKGGCVSARRYWDIPTDIENLRFTEDEAASEFKRLFTLSVKRRLASDVPLGVFLSGGIDSSSVVAAMSHLMPAKDIRSFSIAFADKSFDESSYARRVADHIGTSHHEEMCTPDDLIKSLPEILGGLDEPIGDASIVPTHMLSRFARTRTTVALGGDGGDELFAGYPTFQAERLAEVYNALPGFMKRGIVEPIVRMLPVSDRNISFDFKLRQFLKGVDSEAPKRHMIWMGSFSPDEQSCLLNYDVPVDTFGDLTRHARAAWGSSRGNRLLYIYSKLYLAEDLLTKVDRASMANSLEVRAPFLDHELVEFVARLPYAMKLKGFKLKYLLKKAFAPMLPPEIATRPKKGFGIPVAKWLKGPLKEMMLDLLSVENIRKEGFFRPGEVSRLIKDHLAGRADNRKKLWTLIMFEQWLERWGNGYRVKR